MNTPKPHPFAKEISAWLQDTTQSLLVRNFTEWQIVPSSFFTDPIRYHAAGVWVGHVTDTNHPPVYEYMNDKCIKAGLTIEEVQQFSLEGTYFWLVDLSQPEPYCTKKHSSLITNHAIEHGLVYANQEEAAAKSKAILKIE